MESENPVWPFTLDAALANAARSQPEPSKALELWTQCLDAGEPWAHHGIGRCHLELGALDLALSHFKLATALAPSSYDAWSSRGLAYERLGKTGPAGIAYSLALARLSGIKADNDPIRRAAMENYRRIWRND